MSLALNCTRRETRCDWEEPEWSGGACGGIPCSAKWLNLCEGCGIGICDLHTSDYFGRSYCPNCYREIE